MSHSLSARPMEESPRVPSTSHSNLHVDNDDILQDYTTYWKTSPERISNSFEDRDNLLGEDGMTSDSWNRESNVGSNPFETAHMTAPAQLHQQHRDATITRRLKHLATRAELLATREERLAIREERLAVKEERLAAKEERLALKEEIETLVKTTVDFDKGFSPPTSAQYPSMDVVSGNGDNFALGHRTPLFHPEHPASSRKIAN
ncbi:MAG: hypothetical protein Q9182_004300 [Xanthomendoza sp. 2 TL-2023]